MKFTTTTSGFGVRAVNGSKIEISSVDFGAVATYHIFSGLGASVKAIGNYTISGAASSHWVVSDSAYLEVRSRTVTITGTPAFNPFAFAVRCGVTFVGSDTFSGSATGPRYIVNTNAIIETSAGGANYLPANSAGSSATGGQYA